MSVEEPRKEQGASSAGLTPKSPVVWVAIAVLVAFGIVFAFMLSQVDADDTRWSRLTFLYGTVEAIVFAAAGALFGTQVQRERVVKAEDRADAATTKAEENVDAATKGKVLAKAAKAEAMTAAPEMAQFGFSPQPGVAPPQEAASVVRLAVLAEELFPE